MVARPTDLPLWFKVTTDLPEKRVWARDPDLRLWLWLLAKAKRANDGGNVRFSYATVCADLAVWRGTKRVKPTKKQVRAALLRLARDGNVTGTEGVHRQAQGRAQGYFVVTLCEWGIWYDLADKTGTRTGTSTGSGRERDGHATGTLNPESDPEAEGSSGSRLAGAVGSDRIGWAEAEQLLFNVRPHDNAPRKGPRLLAASKYAQAFHRAGAIDDARYDELLAVKSPGRLLSVVDGGAFNALAGRVQRGSAMARDLRNWARTALADEWLKTLKEIA